MGTISGLLLLGGGLLAAACPTPLEDSDSKGRVPEEPCPLAHMVPCPDKPQEKCCAPPDMYGYSTGQGPDRDPGLSTLIPGTDLPSTLDAE